MGLGPGHLGRVPEAQVQRRNARRAIQRTVYCLHAELPGRVSAGLKPRLVKLHDVDPGGEEVAHLGVHRLGKRQRECAGVDVVLVDALLREGEGAGHGYLDGPVRGGAQEAGLVQQRGTISGDGADDAGHLHRRAGAAPGDDARSLGVDAAERRRECAGVALAAHFAVGDDVNAGAFHVANGDGGGVVERPGQRLGGHAPKATLQDAGDRAARQDIAVDEPVRLGVTADNRGGQELFG